MSLMKRDPEAAFAIDWIYHVKPCKSVMSMSLNFLNPFTSSNNFKISFL